MLKSYDLRVNATYALMQCFIDFTSRNSAVIKETREEAKLSVKTQAKFPISWKLDNSTFASINYKGYEAGYKSSEVSGQPHLYYDRTKPFEIRVPFYNQYEADAFIEKPKAYIVQGWWKIIELLKIDFLYKCKCTCVEKFM